MPRVTIKEIAQRAGVSKGAVSYALNGRPGVSEATRARVLQVAAELDWRPNSAARMLSGARTATFGLVLTRQPETLGNEPFFMQFVAGLERVLGPRGHALLLQVAHDLDVEMTTLRTWSAERRVDAVVVVDLRVGDPRVPLLRELGLPAVVVGDPSLAGGLPCVWTDDAAAVEEAVGHLVALGHRRLARVAGSADLGHVQIRDLAFAAATAAAGVSALTLHTDFSGQQGGQVTKDLVLGDSPPTAVLYDNDLMAVAGLSALNEAGVSVPEQVTLLAWDDSALCRVTHPRLSAVGHDVVAYGAAVAERLFQLLDGSPPDPVLAHTPRLHERASSGPPPGGPVRPRATTGGRA
ncbi:LacI family DNA-binding transcriptional regulator [uncultured Pseudokineococcus sp.]|uniref:LacI family DNA-binding transcriptional regulator n=1 Tax=uncultured Pseudokineococcus sp. TaxID=1642928 RepID=UPI00261E1946|nr:LacI family DNA-binding transcriptional regulator [uncultured Pseudokineococcus sp.]